MQRPIDRYNRYFRIVHADSEELRQASYRLRYQVLTQEHEFLDHAAYPDEMETDQHDAHAQHYLLEHIPSGTYAGSVRIVFSQPGAMLPVMLSSPAPEVCDPALLPVGKSGEISRFNVSKAFRRRAGDADAPSDAPTPSRAAKRPNSAHGVTPYLTLGLMQAAVRCSAEHKLTHLAAIMTPSLIRQLGRAGIRFNAVGPQVQVLGGSRQPTLRRLRDLLTELRLIRRDVWDILTNDGAYWEALSEQESDVAA